MWQEELKNMYLKKFLAKNIQEGWRKVKETLGEDAIILSIKEINNSFEIIAASPEKKVESIKKKYTKFANLKNFITELEKSSTDEHLKEEIEEDIVLTYTPIIKEDLENISKKIKSNPLNKKFIILFGNISSGKSVTAAKLAAILKFERDKKICIASFDFYKIGGSEAVQTFAEIMQIPFVKIESEKDFILNKDFFEEFDHIILDTPGNINELKDVEKFSYLISKGSQTENILVIPLTKKERLIEKDIHYFSKFNIEHLILTKYDQIENKIPLYYILSISNYPISYIANGVKVPEDIFHAEKLLEEKVL